MNRAPDGATIGERGRMSENPRWIMPPEALTRSSDVERWFIRMERYFRAADVPDNRRAAMVQYHMDEAMGDVLSALEVEETDDYDKLKSTLFRVFGVNNSEERYMKEFINRRQRENESVEEYAGHLKRLLPKAFPQLKDQADGILLQQFEAGIRQDMIKFTILRSAPDSFEKAVKIAAREELMINQVTAATGSASVVTTAANVKKETAGHEGETGSAAAIHAGQPKQKPFCNDAVGNAATALRVGHVANWATLAETAMHTLEANTAETSRNLGRVPKPSIRLEAASGAELAVTNAYVMEIVLGGTVRVQHTVLWVKGLSHQFLLGWDFMRSHGCTPDPVANCLRMRQSSIPFTKPIAVAPVGTKPANGRSQILVAMEQMLPKEQEAGGKYRPTLSAILEQFSDVLATSDEDLGRTSVIRHAIHTGDAKPVRCSPRRIAYHQRAQVETLLNE
ncbi:hypothetical protein T4A_14031, partial [Trichinella pseudospiralis]